MCKIDNEVLLHKRLKTSLKMPNLSRDTIPLKKQQECERRLPIISQYCPMADFLATRWSRVKSLWFAVAKSWWFSFDPSPHCGSNREEHGLINYIGSKAKGRRLKLTCKGTLRQEFIRVYRLEIQSVICISWTVATLTFSLLQLTSPSPFRVPKYNIYKQCVAGRGWVVLSLVGDHILQEFSESEPTKLVVTGQFFYFDDILLCCLYC